MEASQILDKLSGLFDEAEVYVSRTKSTSYELKNSKDFSKQLEETGGIGIRAIKNNRMVFVSASNSEKIDEIIKEALASVNVSKELDCRVIPNKQKMLEVKLKPIQLDEASAKDRLNLIADTAKNFDKRIKDVKSASIGSSFSHTEIANSSGLKVSFDKNYAFAFTEILAEDKTSDTSYYFLDSDNPDTLNLKLLSKKAANLAVNKLYPKPINTKKYSVIISNFVFRDILAHFLSIFNAYSVISHTTPLEGKLYEQVFSDKITIIDKRECTNRPNNVPVDDEGNLRKDVTIVENGILKTFMHNTYTSEKLKAQNTHQAKRASFSSIPKVGPFNLILKPNESISRDKLMNMIDGLYITEVMGLHMANTISGDFSVGINGFLIHNGELISYFKAATFADNFFNMMKRVIELSNSMYFSGSVGSPDIAIADCVIGGGNG